MRKTDSVVPAILKVVVRSYSARNNWRNWIYLAADWGLIGAAVATYWLRDGAALYVPVVLLIGTRMRALANLLHESAHFKLFASRRLNTCVGAVFCAWPLGIAYNRYVRQHHLHHRLLWTNDQDPDLDLYRSTGTETASKERTSFARFVIDHVLLAILPVQTLRRLLRKAGVRRTLLTLVITVVWLVGLTLINRTLGTVVLLYWIVPWLTTYQTITYWAELGEHGGLRRRGPNWGSRNWSGSLVSRHVVGVHSDDRFHLLHHWFPSVPHYRLSTLDSVCRSEWTAYREETRCGGFFLGGPDAVSVLRDIWDGGARRSESGPSSSDRLETAVQDM